MYDFTFENKGANSYLVYKFKPDDRIDTMTLGMITNNKITGFAPCVFTQLNETRYMKYNISAKVPVRQIFAGTVNRRRLIGVFGSVVDALILSDDYMIAPESLVLDLNYMYADVSTCETLLVCIPVTGYEMSEPDVKAFFKGIMFHTQFDQTEDCDYVAHIINYLNRDKAFSPAEFKKLLEEIGSLPAEPEKPKPVPGSVPPDGGQTTAGGAGVKTKETKIETGHTAPPESIKPGGAVQQPATPPVNGGKQVNTAPATGSNAAVPGNYGQPATPGRNAGPTGSPTPVPTGPPYRPSNTPVPPVSPVNPVNPVNPVQPVHPVTPNPPVTPANEGEKPMSRMYLLQHYNKENAELYKKQKAQEKARKREEKKNRKKKNGAQPMNIPSSGQQNRGFAVPGQPNNAGMVNPQQQTVNRPQYNTAQPPLPVNKQQLNHTAQPSVPGSRQPAGAQPGAIPNYGVSIPPAAQPVIKPTVQPTGAGTVPPAVIPTSIPQQNAGVLSYTPTELNNQLSGDPLETTVLGGNDDGLTAVLNVNPGVPVKKPYIIRVRNNERVPVDKQIFKIGKEKTYADYYIGDNTYISRGHANIVQHDGKYFIVDNNSRNHTYVNGEFITSNIEVELHSGDTFRLANEDFEFKLF